MIHRIPVCIIIIMVFLLSYNSLEANTKNSGFKVLKVSKRDVSVKTYGKLISLPYHSQGEIFTIEWKNPRLPLNSNAIEIVFKFRREKSNEVETKTGTVNDLTSGRFTTEIENTGKEFKEKGRITVWKVLLLYNGKEAAEKSSSQWYE